MTWSRCMKAAENTAHLRLLRISTLLSTLTSRKHSSFLPRNFVYNSRIILQIHPEHVHNLTINFVCLSPLSICLLWSFNWLDLDKQLDRQRERNVKPRAWTSEQPLNWWTCRQCLAVWAPSLLWRVYWVRGSTFHPADSCKMRRDEVHNTAANQVGLSGST